MTVVQVKDSAHVSTVLIGRTRMSELDKTAIELVALDGHRMDLKKEERLEAIKIMSQHNVPQEQIAWRLCMKLEALRRFATRAKIKLPLATTPAHWSVDYIDKRLPERKQVARENAARQGKSYRERQRSTNVE